MEEKKPRDLATGPEQDAYMSKKRTARYLDVSVRTLEKMMKQESLPFYRLPTGSVRFFRTEVDLWLQQYRQLTHGCDVKALADEALNSVLKGSKGEE